MTSRAVDYQWHLTELMARNAMHNTTDLASHLTERGITLSASQVYRLVTNRPERISLPILSALCDIFGCTPAELITVTAENAKPTKKIVNSEVIDLNTQVRPRRARVVSDD
ncbi:helix-turn-helix transcriptional regulator [Herbiconiux moechotypicola]|uniref:HTH cro/C1-type domain-containing protein n=1 Tax=Herbiconiux moechotypicola TaxID=637393 RepID=A0ABN3E1J5_9MICO|nr:helix-turn-helix transcriptional regulator [Herbiconiux moechotypicola]MCS5731334.1 helix-turn-helix transcriptional regulator [Herbiconiux moechotypicola]